MTSRIKLGVQTITVGSRDSCDIRLTGDAVLPIEAEIVHGGDGALILVPAPGSDWRVSGVPQGEKDFRLEPLAVCETHGALLDTLHPVLLQMQARRGELPSSFGELIIGRDPSECHLVLLNPSVSSRHATVQFPPFPGAAITITDHGSKSGTRVGQRIVAPGETAELEARDVIALGSAVLSVRALTELHEGSLGPPAEPVHPTFTEDGHSPSAPRKRHHTVVGSVRIEAARSWTIGRSKESDIILDYPQVSSHHATLRATGGQILIEDAESDLGTIVEGVRLRPGQRRVVETGAEIQLGPIATKLSIDAGSVALVVAEAEGPQLRPTFEIEADEVTVRVLDKLRPGHDKILIDRLSFKALPGDLIALMGPSGAGKTTLLHVLTGAISPSHGEVRVNGRPLSSVFDSLRGSIGYVPQDDIVHAELTVREAVTYSARLRLPADFTPTEIDARVTRTLEELGLSDVAHLRIGKPEAKVLSGGQRKRVNIAMELVTDPVLLFLDEPTSGLAADDTAQLIALLEKMAHSGGKTIIATIHQPARREYERFNLALVLGPGGVPLYFGPTAAAYAFFEAWRPPAERARIDNPRDMFAELSERTRALARSDPARAKELTSSLFRKEYEESALARAMQSGRRAKTTCAIASDQARARPRARSDLGILVARYTKIKLRDPVSTAILLLQAPLIGVLLGLVFGDQKASAPAWCFGALDQLRTMSGATIDFSGLPERILPAIDRSAALFFMVVSAIWFGTSNAAREIVSERAIYAREHMVHLSAFRYVTSKFIVLSLLSVLQCSALLGILWFLLRLSGGASAFALELGILCLTAICSVALGLVISSVVKTSEAAMALTPIALIPQVVLGGLMVPITTVPWLKWAMLIVPARWGFQGIIGPERVAVQSQDAWNIGLGPETPDSIPDFIDHATFRCALAHLESEQLTGALGLGSSHDAGLPIGALALTTVILLVGVLVLLERGTRRQR